MSELVIDPQVFDEETALQAALRQKVVITVQGETVVMDPGRLELRDATIKSGRFFDEESSWYNYFGRHVARAEMVVASLEADLEAKYNGKFAQFKESEKASDKLADAKSKCDQEVVDLKKKIIEAKFHVKLIAQHLKSWDKTHDNAQNRGHTLRKEMDKMNSEIYGSSDSSGSKGYSNRVSGPNTQTTDLDKLLEEVGK
jgi:hypothetical protein